MNERLKFLIQKNSAKRKRDALFPEFLCKMQDLTRIDLSEVAFSSFEETREALAKIRKIETKALDQCWSSEKRQEFEKRISCIRSSVDESEIVTIFHDRYLFIGAMRMSPKLFFKNIWHFFSLGEDTLVVARATLDNFFWIARYEDSMTESGYFYSIEAGGELWSKVMSDCQ